MVSIIVPVYNVESYLDHCVESVLRLGTELEVLLVDDGSTDGSGALCDAWAEKDGRIRVLHQKNRGLSGARNTALRNARGSHVLFLDSDDFLDPTETDRLLAQLQATTDVALGLYNNYYEDDRYEREPCEPLLQCTGEVATETLLKAIPRDGSGCYMTAWRFICRREFLLQHDLFFFEGIYHEDEEWTQRLLCHAQSVLVTDCLFYQYRQGRAGAITTAVKPKHLLDSCTILRHALALAKAYPERQAYLQSRMGMLYLNGLIHMHNMGEEKRAVYQQLCALRGCGRYMTGRIGTPVRLCMAVLGIRITSTLLALVRKIVK